MKARGVNLLNALEQRLKGMPFCSVNSMMHPDGYLCVSARMSHGMCTQLNVKVGTVLYADISLSGLTKITNQNRPTTLFNLCSFYMKDAQDWDASAVELDERIWLDFEAVHKGVLRDMLFGIDEHNRKNVQKFGYYRPTVMFNATDEDYVYGLVSDYFMRYCHK